MGRLDNLTHEEVCEYFKMRADADAYELEKAIDARRAQMRAKREADEAKSGATLKAFKEECAAKKAASEKLMAQMQAEHEAKMAAYEAEKRRLEKEIEDAFASAMADCDRRLAECDAKRAEIAKRKANLGIM